MSHWDSLPREIQRIILAMKSYRVFEDELLRTTSTLKTAIEDHTENYEMFKTRKRIPLRDIPVEEYPIDENAPHYEPHYEWVYVKNRQRTYESKTWKVQLVRDWNTHASRCSSKCACREFRLYNGWKRNECIFTDGWKRDECIFTDGWKRDMFTDGCQKLEN